MYIPRMLEPNLGPADSARVKVLHGARAVGKTTLAQHLRDAGLYDDFVSLADQRVLQVAQADPRGWLRGLANNVVIDEAQLLPGLPLELKSLADKVGTSRHWLLTGSASIGRTGLGGTDPLAGRAETWTLFPFIQTELNGRPESGLVAVAQLLGSPPTLEREIVPPADMTDRMTRGGLPSLALTPLAQSARNRWVRDAVAGILTDNVLPDERFDKGTAQLVLDACLQRTGSVLNVTKMASELGINSRTLDRYLDVLERRFLVWFLPNAALSGSRQTRARSKVYPVDPAFAVECFQRHDPAALADPGQMGHVWESYVINSLRAMTTAAPTQPTMLYWRSPRGDREVDLVLADGTGPGIGIEVKASTKVELEDARGLASMLAAGEIRGGYVVYAGTRLIRLTDNVWGVPFDALSLPWDEPAATPIAPLSQLPKPDPLTEAVSRDARIFVSYVHADNDFLGQAMTHFVDALAQTYEYLYAHPLQIEYDKRLLRWGQDWQPALDDAVAETDFLMAFVTPRYLVSTACRDEITTFSARAESDGLLLPLVWEPIEGKGIVQDSDPVLALIRRHQYEDGTALGGLEPGSTAYRTELTRLATRLHDTITTLERPTTPTVRGREDNQIAEDDDPPGLAELLDDLQDAQRAITVTQQEFTDALTDLAAQFLTINVDNLQGPARNAELIHYRTQAEPTTQALESASETLSTQWNQFLVLLRQFSDGCQQMEPSADIRAQLRTTLMPLSTWSIPERADLLDTMRKLSTMSRHFRPMSRAVLSALRAADGLRESAATWLNELG